MTFFLFYDIITSEGKERDTPLEGFVQVTNRTTQEWVAPMKNKDKVEGLPLGSNPFLSTSMVVYYPQTVASTKLRRGTHFGVGL